jgi:hypothetical protein
VRWIASALTETHAMTITRRAERKARAQLAQAERTLDRAAAHLRAGDALTAMRCLRAAEQLASFEAGLKWRRSCEADRRQAFLDAERALKENEAALAIREARLDVREERLAERAAALDKREAELKDYERQVNEIYMRLYNKAPDANQAGDPGPARP